MKVVTGRPPIYDDIVRVVGRPPAGALFTWGDTIFHDPPPPGFRHSLSPDILAHERTHSSQQASMGAGPWWTRYLESPEFRLEQEVEAYQVQYGLACRMLGRAERRELLRRLAKDLSSAMYGRLCSLELARALIVGDLLRDVEPQLRAEAS